MTAFGIIRNLWLRSSKSAACFLLLFLLPAVGTGSVFGAGIVEADTAGAPDAVPQVLMRAAAAEQQLEQLQMRLGHMAAALQDLQARSRQQAGPDTEQLDALEAQTVSKQQEVEQLVKAIRRLEEAAGETTETPDQNGLQELEAQIRRAQDELDRLTGEEARLLEQARPENGGGLETGTVVSGMDAVPVALVAGRVVRVTKPYYEFTQGYARVDGSLVNYLKIARVQDGTPIGEAVKEGGLLDTVFDELDPDTDYVNFLVTADSISAYRTAMRQAASRNLKYTWTTWVDEDFYLRLDNLGDSDGSTILFGNK